MSIHRRLAHLAILLVFACSCLLVGAGSASAGVVTRVGTILVYTSSAGQADRLQVRQSSPTAIVFDDAFTALTAVNAPGCNVLVGNVACSGTAWTSVTVDLRDQGDSVIGSYPGLEVQVPMGIQGGPGFDGLGGGAAGDVIYPEQDGGSADGFGGDDQLRATTDPGRISFDGGPGNDQLDARPSSGPANMYGGDGNDVLRAGSGDSNLRAEAGDDQVFGGAGIDSIYGGVGRDELDGGANDDYLEGGDLGIGAVVGSDGSDVIRGGAGFDRVSYAGRTNPVVVDLATPGGDGEAGENDATAADIENATGGRGPDQLFGNGGSNDLRGLEGADRLEGRGEFDQLRGNADADTLVGTGDDVADFVDCGTTFTTQQPPLAEGSDVDTAELDHLDIVAIQGDCETITRLAPPVLPVVSGTAQPNTLRGTGAADELLGRGGNDTIFGLGGNDRIRGGTGNDRLFGGFGNDDIDGDAGNDQLHGQAGNDTLDGGLGRDLLLGGPGRDTLVGGRGIDRLDGGLARDFLMARDGQRLDIVTCTRVNLATRAGRLQRDVVVVDRGDVIRNRAWCARVTFT